MPGGPYNNIPDHGLRTPLKRSGNFIGKIIASCKAFFAPSSPEMSSHLILGFSVTIASDKAFLNLSFSSSGFCPGLK